MMSIVAGIALAFTNFFIGVWCLFLGAKSSFNGFISIVFGGMVARLGVSALLILVLFMLKVVDTIYFSFAFVLSYPLLLVIEMVYAVKYLQRLKKVIPVSRKKENR
jgi:hypothetical protein